MIRIVNEPAHPMFPVPAASRGRGADAAAMTALQADFPGFHIWQSNLGRWWATRLGQRAAQPLCLDADTAAGLRAALEADAERQRARA